MSRFIVPTRRFNVFEISNNSTSSNSRSSRGVRNGSSIINNNNNNNSQNQNYMPPMFGNNVISEGQQERIDEFQKIVSPVIQRLKNQGFADNLINIYLFGQQNVGTKEQPIRKIDPLYNLTNDLNVEKIPNLKRVLGSLTKSNVIYTRLRDQVLRRGNINRLGALIYIQNLLLQKNKIIVRNLKVINYLIEQEMQRQPRNNGGRNTGGRNNGGPIIRGPINTGTGVGGPIIRGPINTGTGVGGRNNGNNGGRNNGNNGGRNNGNNVGSTLGSNQSIDRLSGNYRIGTTNANASGIKNSQQLVYSPLSEEMELADSIGEIRSAQAESAQAGSEQTESAQAGSEQAESAAAPSSYAKKQRTSNNVQSFRTSNLSLQNQQIHYLIRLEERLKQIKDQSSLPPEVTKQVNEGVKKLANQIKNAKTTLELNNLAKKHITFLQPRKNVNLRKLMKEIKKLARK
jgi:hypothetical protein